jgi:hypothetical protein
MSWPHSHILDLCDPSVVMEVFATYPFPVELKGFASLDNSSLVQPSSHPVNARERTHSTHLVFIAHIVPFLSPDMCCRALKHMVRDRIPFRRSPKSRPGE